MGITRRVAAYLGLVRESDPSTAVTPPPRSSAGFVTADGALSLGPVYRAVQVLATAGSQLSLDVTRDGEAMKPAPSVVRRPSLDVSRSAFLEETITGLALAGNAFWRITRGSENEALELEVLDPHKVRVWKNENGRVRYAYGQRDDYTRNDIQHLQLMRRSGRERGLGPIQAAREDLAGAQDLRDYATGWFGNAGVPSVYRQ